MDLSKLLSNIIHRTLLKASCTGRKIALKGIPLPNLHRLKLAIIACQSNHYRTAPHKQGSTAGTASIFQPLLDCTESRTIQF